jgi:hypothetical protein
MFSGNDARSNESSSVCRRKQITISRLGFRTGLSTREIFSEDPNALVNFVGATPHLFAMPETYCRVILKWFAARENP